MSKAKNVKEQSAITFSEAVMEKLTEIAKYYLPGAGEGG